MSLSSTAADGAARAFVQNVMPTPRVSPYFLFQRFQEGIRERAIQDGVDSIRLKHTVKDLATGSNTAPEAVDSFKKEMNQRFNEETARNAANQLSEVERDTYTKIVNDVRPEGKKPGAGARHIYLQLLDHPNTLKDPDLFYIQAYDAREALTSPSKANSDAAFERMATRFRLEPELNPNKAVLTLLETRDTANRKRQLGSLVGQK